MSAIYTTAEGEAHIADARKWAATRGLLFVGDCAAWAIFSPDRVYRYLLGRTWDTDGPTARWTMLNPSKAGVEDDPTIRRVVSLSRRRAGGVLVRNRFALVSTDPKRLLTHDDPRGPHNDDAQLFGNWFGYGVAAWGVMPKKLAARATYPHVAAWCYGKTKYGHPRHPLYLRADMALVNMIDERPFP